MFLAGSFGALLVGWLVVVVRGLYLARHIFTLFNANGEIDNYPKKCTACELLRRYSLNLSRSLCYMGPGAPVEPF